MRLLIAIIVFFSLVFNGLAVYASEVPMGVNVKKVYAEYEVPGTRYKDALGDNGTLDAGELTNVKIQNKYILELYNVGLMGGEQYQEAILIHRIVSLDGGEFYKTKGADGYPKKNSYPPEWPDQVYRLKFSGGPEGKLTGSYVEGIVHGKEGTVELYFLDKSGNRTNGYTLNIKDDAFKDWIGLTSNFDQSKNTSNFNNSSGEREDSGARFSSLNGEVETRPDSDPKGWLFAKLKTILYVTDHVKTGEESTAIIGFADLSTFKLAPESEIVITTPAKKDSKIKLVAGNIWANVKKLIKDGTMEVETSQAVAGIKGTTFVLEDNGKTATLKVIEGVVEYKSKVPGVNSVMVKSGEMAVADSGGIRPVEKFDVAKESRKWDFGNSKRLFWLICGIAIVIFVGLVTTVLIRRSLSKKV